MRSITLRALSVFPSAAGRRASLVPCCAAKKSTAVTRTSNRVSKDVAEYWQQWLDQTVDKPTAARMLHRIDVHQVLGLPMAEEGAAESAWAEQGAAAAEVDPAPQRGPAAKGGRGKGGRGQRPPLYTFFHSVKKQHPKAVALVRVGEFYEGCGIDAVLLVQHAGLNPMGQGGPPRAGCPRVNLRQTVNDLVRVGLSVVVCEEVPEAYSWGSMRNKNKERFVAAVVTPANPHLLHGLLDDNQDLQIDAAAPLLAVVPQVGGYTVLEVSVDLQTVTVMEGLTEDAVYARLHEGGLAPPLFLHVPAASSSADRRLKESTFEREWEQRVAATFKSQIGAVERYSDPDWLQGLLTRVRVMLGLSADTHFTIIRASTRDRPRPLYFCTALNLGLHKARGQPCILDYMLPPASPLPVRNWIRRLLLLPPPPATAASVHRICSTLEGMRESLPVFPIVPAAGVVLKLRTGQANDIFFREVGELCRAILDLLSRGGEQMPVLASNLLDVACKEMGVGLTQDQLCSGLTTSLERIHAVVDHDTQLLGGGSDWMPALDGCEQEVQEGLQKLITANEFPFRGKVRDEVMAKDNQAVAMARERVWRELDFAFLPLQQAHLEAAGAAKLRPSIIYDSANNALWIRIPKNSAALKAATELHHPHDRNGKIDSSCYASHGLQSALDDYRRACYEAAAAVRQHLRDLARELQAVQTELVCGATMSVAAAALDAHTREARRRKWSLPTLAHDTSYVPAAEAGTAPWEPQAQQHAQQHAQQQVQQHTAQQLALEPAPFEMVEFWPYWLDTWAHATVHNTLNLEGMALLTGPNMAGKSTILRSVCAVALLGACGLFAPAASATLPYFDAFMLRNFSSDSPLEGRSSFAVEMTEMRYVLEDLSPNSLVLVDELGKGTEVRAGAALAGALLEQLDASGCRGIFATHLHSLLDLNLELDNTAMMMMETAPAQDSDEETLQQLIQGVGNEPGTPFAGSDNGSNGSGHTTARSKPTWRIVEGVSTESLALDVARRCRMPANVTDRAEQLYEQLVPMAASSSQDSGGSSSGSDSDSVATLAAQQAEGELAAAGEARLEAGLAPRGRAARSGGRGRAALGSSSSSAASSPWTLAAAADSLQQVARDALANCAAETSGGTGQQVQHDVQYVRQGQAPAPSVVGESCTYVLRRSDGHFYAGSTDSLYDRIRAHRQRTGKGGPGMELVFVSLGRSQGAAGLVKAVESGIIRELQRRGFPMLSATDARRRHVAGAGGSGSSVDSAPV
ncbi:hypothetical protein D9Q98_004652 [Chlorella vulgaris]|uniref:DNA mismatch repair proteins mutS family domain-containing protein n=1 Tax=Chlorella vulgaris TaxID=3077 RepID=A0A9D4TQB5_CHLVU|nr:hypothetical protein D9Q98_004652 [Chlorella vulgaris]